jgi:hypothetical protein
LVGLQQQPTAEISIKRTKLCLVLRLFFLYLKLISRMQIPPVGSARQHPSSHPSSNQPAVRRREKSFASPPLARTKSAVAAALAFPNFASSECAGGSNFGYWLITSVAN